MAKRAKSGNSCVELPDDDDRISNLPDGIRCHILSFLCTKDAVATTALSTEWKNLWTTALNDISFCDDWYPFSCRSYGDSKTMRIKFAQTVNKVLHSHKLPVIKRFSLDCIQDSVYNVHAWVSMVIGKKVEDLYLSIEAEDDAPIQLPTSFFTCETLEVLKLQGSIIIGMIDLGSLPRLRKLELSIIDYQNDESARMLISSCQSLESLDITRQLDDGVNTFSIISSTLKYLTIDQSNCFECPLYQYVISALTLEHLELHYVPADGVFIKDLSSLVKTNISFSDVFGLYDDNFYNLLRGISNSKNLMISTNSLQPAAIPTHMVPKFDRLSSLEVNMDCCKWHSLQEFIKNSDRLEALVFRKNSCAKKRHLVCWRNPKTVPICLLSCLKTMTFFQFHGLKDELRMVEYILKNANVMQKMEIHFHHSLGNTETEPQLREKLLKFLKGSEECQVIIY